MPGLTGRTMQGMSRLRQLFAEIEKEFEALHRYQYFAAYLSHSPES